jgi:periplasmic divalent cation tolerance protein
MIAERTFMQLIMLLLTCANRAEAERISITLLEKKFIACAKMMPVHAMFAWEGVIKADDEVMLVMESSQELCHDIEEVVRSVHSYATFVLTGFPIAYISPQAKEWLCTTLTVKL